MPNIISETEWLATPLGAHVAAQEQAMFDAAVADIFGFNAVQLGMPQLDLLRDSRMLFRCAAAKNGNTALRCEFEQLPLATGSVDLLLLPHVLEFADNPHQVLRDAERALMAEGHIIISGFNPISFWGLYRVFCEKRDYPWRGRLISLMRLKDWLALLGFEIVAGRMGCYAPPVTSPKWLSRMAWMDKAGDRWWPMMGGVYFLVARKKVIGMRLIRPQWNHNLARVLIPKPTQKTECQKERVEGAD